MNIFYIPSWYPEKKNPNAGIFFKEQAVALAEAYPDINFLVSIFSSEKYSLVFKKPVNSFLKTVKFIGVKGYINRVRSNLCEMYSPGILYTKKLQSYDKKIVKINEKNFLKGQGIFGKFDLIHCQVSFPAGYAGMMLSKKYNIPFIITEHMGPFPFDEYLEDSKLSYRINEPLKKAKKVIAVSNSLAGSIEKFEFERPDVIPNLVDEDLFKIGSAQENDKFTFFTLSSITEQKGIGVLLNSIKSAVEKDKNIHFRIGGTGEVLGRYKELSGKENLSGYITWLGALSREESVNEFQKCDCFILPSFHESFGLVLVEAIACGKPVIATRCGGPEDIVNEENGVLINKGNEEELSGAILNVKKNANRYKPELIRKYFIDNFSKDVVTKRTVNIYKECLNKG
jgi:glycosyltransferase involved in cell wall biosynthesis